MVEGQRGWKWIERSVLLLLKTKKVELINCAKLRGLIVQS